MLPVALEHDAVIDEALLRHFGAVEQVRYILTEHAPDALLVWIALDDGPAAVRRRIYDEELALLTGFPDAAFDFNLVLVSGRTAAEIASGATVVYTRGE